MWPIIPTQFFSTNLLLPYSFFFFFFFFCKLGFPFSLSLSLKLRAAMAKKRKSRNHEEIDNIAKYTQQRRSPGGSKRRTDFSHFFCTSPDLLRDSPSSKEIISTVTMTGSDDINVTRRNICDLPLDRYTESEEKRQGLFSNSLEVPVIKVQSVGQNATFRPCSNRSEDEGSDSARPLEFTPDKSQITENIAVCITPGSVVWVRTALQCWWPAEVLGERSTLVGSNGVEGKVLVQYYGKHESAWVDPARDLSRFEECFEERSCNPTEEFQNALKQALYSKEHLKSSKELFSSPDRHYCSDHLDQSPDNGNSSSSSRAAPDYLGRGRSKRERKPTARFDEAKFPLKSVRKVRRFRIMRFLGLAAPVGSPFLTTTNLRVATEWR